MDQHHKYFYQNPVRSLPPPPPPPEMPPFPQRPRQGSSDRFHQGGDSWRPSVPSKEFTFRNDPSAPQFPKEIDRYVQSSRRIDDRPRRNNNRRGNTPNNRGWGYRRPTAERPLLRSRRGSSPEDMLGQADAQNKTHRFLPAGDVSDSDEEEMEESDVDQQLTLDRDQHIVPHASPEGEFIILDVQGASEAQEPPKNRRATTVNTKEAKEAAALPRWSNPDPYTVLPPVDETHRKRKDVVKIIRKARIVAEKEAATENQVAANDDFISFGLGGDDNTDDRSRSPSPPESRDRDEHGVQGAPTGPREFSHLNNLHSFAPHRAPGTSDQRLSANDLGPPPDLTNRYPLTSGRGVSKVDLYPEQAEALGNRKRTLDDDIKGDVIPTRKKKAASNGSVLQQWIPRGDADPTPWLAGDHRPTENSGFRLHKEICDFHEFVRPQRHEQIIREDLLQRLQKAVKKQLPDCALYCFGSFAAEMYLPNADMDLVVISSTFRSSGRRVACQTQNHMHQFAHHLEQAGVATRGSTQVIFKAKVPLVKFVDHMTGIQVDVSFENETGLVANETFNAWKHQFPAMPILTTLIKQFLKMRGLSEVVNGGLGGFSVTCLVTSLLQNLPRVQSGEVIPEQHLGEILLEFLDLYGNQFDLGRTGISMNPPGYYDKQAAERSLYRQGVYRGSPASKLAITDPNNRENDISGGSKNVGVIFDLFSDAHDEILKAMRSPHRINLLDWALGGDYREFTVQRRHLLELYHSKWGSFEPSQTSPGTHVPYPSLPSSNEKRQRTTSSLSGLPGAMFSNPLDPNIIVQPKIKVPKIKKKFKANQNETKSNLSNTKGIVPSSKVTFKTQNRARKLKAEFPSKAMEIPDAVNKQGQRILVENFKAEGIVPIEINQGNIMAVQRKGLREASGQPRKPCTKPKKAKNLKPKPKPQPQPKAKPKAQPKLKPNIAHGVSHARFAEAARNIGSANNLPIIID